MDINFQVKREANLMVFFSFPQMFVKSIILLAPIFLVESYLFAVTEKPIVKGPGNVEPLVRLPKKPPRMAKVRIFVKLVPYRKVLMQDSKGVNFEEYKPVGKMKYTLRARIDRPNHFYLNDWHIETIPQMFSQSTKQFRVKLRFYKRYGTHQDLEEYVGNTTAEGILEGSNFLYVLKTFKEEVFKNKYNQPILAIGVGKEASKRRPLLSRQITPVK